MKKVELLSPARNLKAIKAATPYADSVYFGIEKFNMRMRAENISLGDLSKVTAFCHKNDLNRIIFKVGTVSVIKENGNKSS